VRHVARVGDEQFIQNFIGKPKGKRPVGRLRRRRVDNVKMNLRGTGWEGVDWIHVAQVGASGGLL
jgi:hypothetical protein